MAATGFFGRLYRGETNFDLVGKRRRWYTLSAVMLLICVLSIALRGFNVGIEFAGGNQFRVPVQAGTSLSQVRTAVEDAGTEVSSAQIAGQGASASYIIRTPSITDAQRQKLETALAEAGQVSAQNINTSQVSSSWGNDVTRKAIQGLIVFLVVVSAFIWIRFRELKMAAAAVLALLHDLLLTAGVYSLVGFEVTPGTVIGLLTILGYSLYDTVVVFDKVDENTRGLLGSSRYTYAEQANRAVNQTLMRSINTSVIGLLPVAGLLFIGAMLLGVGTLKDLALVLFVGMLTGAYSSLFLATPWLVDLKMREPRYKAHAQRVLARRRAAETPAVATDAAGEDGSAAVAAPAREDALAGAAPRPGARPANRRPGGKTNRPTGRKRH
jgi:preprotein translocase subunit SecF